MAKGKGGSAQGAHLASGFISLSVRYASAMGQIADDFGVMEKRSKAVGESITKNLVAGADSAKAKVQELNAAYEAQRQKVAALKTELQSTKGVAASVAAAQAAYTAGLQRDNELRRKGIQQDVDLQEKLRRAIWAAKDGAKTPDEVKRRVAESAAIKDIQAQQAASAAQRKQQIKELAALEKNLRDARANGGNGDELEIQKALDAEVAKAKGIFEQYGKAVEDAARKQDLARTSADGLKTHLSMGQRFAHMLGLPFGPAMSDAGTKAGQGFRKNFSMQMYQGKSEVAGHARSLANGLLMGMTPGVMGAAGVGIALGKAFSAGFNREETLNTTKLRLQALGTDAATVKQLMGDALGTVEGTQFSLAASFSAASTAMQSGIKAGPDMVQYLNNIANAAGLTGVEYGEVAESIGRVQRLGTVSLENIDPLIKKDLPVLKWLKEYYQKDFPNTTTQDITEMISKKLIPADVLNKVLTKNLNNGMKGLTKQTTKGALADLGTQVGKVSQSILAPFMKDWPTTINALSEKLKRFSDYIRPGMERFASWLKTTWNTLWPKVTGAVGTAVDWIKAKWEEWWPTIKMVIDKVISTVSEMWPQLKAKFEPWMQAIKRLWDALYPIVAPVIKAIGALAGWLALEFVKHAPAFMQFATNIINWLSTALEWLRTKFWPWLKDMWKTLKENVADSWKAIGEWKDKIVAAFNWVKDNSADAWTWLEGKLNWLTDKMDFLRRNAHWITDPWGSIVDAINGTDENGQARPYNNAAYTTPIITGNTNSIAAYAQSQSGKQYGYGGVGPGSTSEDGAGLYDCSGFISDIYAMYTGKPYSGNERYFTTESNFGALGFKPGNMPGAFNIGIHRGGGGKNSHMAGTLPNGMNVESGSNGTQYGAGAAGALDAQFELHYYLPVGSPSPSNPVAALAPSAGGVPGLAPVTDPYSAANTNPALTGPIIVRGAPGQGFPVPWKLSGGDSTVPQPPSPAPGTVGGIPIPGLSGSAPSTFPEAVNVPAPEADKGFWDHIIEGFNPGKVLNPDWWIGKIFGEPEQKLPALGTKLPGGGKSYTFGGAPADGPKGTKDDPVTTKDPQVAKNTDPANPENKPEPGSATTQPGAPGETPHGGTGAQPGPTGTSTTGKDDGKNAQSLVGGLAGVGQTAFSNQFEGTPFSNPLDWPGTKSVGALFSFFGSVLSGNSSGGASGLAGLLSPGKAAGLDYKDQRQIRESDQRVKKTAADAAKAKSDMDAMVGKPQFTPEDRQKAADDYANAQQDATDAVQDHAELLKEMGQKENPGGLRGLIQNLMQGKPLDGNAIGGTPGASAIGPGPLIPAPSGGGTSIFSPEAFGNPLPGTPGVAPGTGDAAMLVPGGSGTPLAAAAGAIPGATDAAPAGNNGGGAPVINNTVNQVVPEGGFVAGQDHARRADNVNINSASAQIARISV